MSRNTKVYGGVIAAAFLFGTMEIALKIAGDDVDSFQLTAVRFFLGGLFLLPFAIMEMKKENSKPNLKQFLYLGFIGIVNIPISMLLFQLGVMKSNASTASVLISMNALFTLIFARIIDKEVISKNKIIAIFVGIIGAFFMIKPWDIQEGNTFMGVFLVLAGAAALGLYTALGKRATEEVGLFTQISFSFIEGSIVLMIINKIIGKPIIAGLGDAILPVLYVSIFVTGLGYLCYFIAIKYSDAATGSVTFFIKPAIAPILAVLILHEELPWNSIVGIALILVASFINLHENKRKDL